MQNYRYSWECCDLLPRPLIKGSASFLKAWCRLIKKKKKKTGSANFLLEVSKNKDVFLSPCKVHGLPRFDLQISLRGSVDSGQEPLTLDAEKILWKKCNMGQILHI